MNPVIKTISLISILLVSGLSFADSGLSKDVPITVTAAANVQDHIGKLPPAEKRRAEEAIKVGAAFMQQYLDGLVCDTQNQSWTEEVGSLVAIDDYNWNEKFCSQEASNWNDWNQKDRPQACSQVSLITLQFENADVTLTYQLIQLGTLSNDSNGPSEFKSQGTGDTKLLVVVVNSYNRVYDITPKGWPDEISYGRSISEMKFGVTNMEDYFKHPVPHIGQTKASINAKYNRYKKLIKQIEQQAAQICR